mmetsp:Transcript_85499/g.247048  ORF Transcript_85499/g.247048 Transcript_85499/m.247048 type:complete len:247 (-) Transcript_85499:256-996(-)
MPGATAGGDRVLRGGRPRPLVLRRRRAIPRRRPGGRDPAHRRAALRRRAVVARPRRRALRHFVGERAAHDVLRGRGAARAAAEAYRLRHGHAAAPCSDILPRKGYVPGARGLQRGFGRHLPRRRFRGGRAPPRLGREAAPLVQHEARGVPALRLARGVGAHKLPQATRSGRRSLVRDVVASLRRPHRAPSRAPAEGARVPRRSRLREPVAKTAQAQRVGCRVLARGACADFAEGRRCVVRAAAICG